MIYQVRANIFFDVEDEAIDFYHDCEVAFPKGISVNPDTEASEFSIIELIRNHHDENPNAPCSIIARHTSQPPPPD